MTGIEPPGWRFSLMEGSSADLTAPSWRAGEVPPFHSDNFVRILCSPDNTAELTGFADALRWTDSFFPCSERVRNFVRLETRCSCRSGCRPC